MEDGSKELSVLVDRSVGGSSIKDGQIELMLHRYMSRSMVAQFVGAICFVHALLKNRKMSKKNETKISGVHTYI